MLLIGTIEIPVGPPMIGPVTVVRILSAAADTHTSEHMKAKVAIACTVPACCLVTERFFVALSFFQSCKSSVVCSQRTHSIQQAKTAKQSSIGELDLVQF
jgi:hypothetical protein